jgi:hypothetical protein
VVASVVAAIAAVIAIVYAAKTVRDAQGARKEAATQHREAMKFSREAADANLVVQRIAVLQEVLAATVDLVDVARSEAQDPPPNIELNGTFTTTTKLPAMQIRLRAVVKFLATIGGPNYIADLPQHADASGSVSAQRVWVESVTLLSKIDANVFDNPALEMP